MSTLICHVSKCRWTRNAPLSRLIAIVLVGGTLGCATLQDLEPLDVTLADLKVTNVTVFETTLVAALRITNPNPEAITIEGASFKLYLEGKKVGTGTAKESFTVDRLDSSLVDVLFHINNASAVLRLKDVLEDDDVSYGISGGLYTRGTFGTKKLKVEKTGHIDLGTAARSHSGEPDAPKSPTSR